MSDAMSECICIEVDVSATIVATINSFEICALCSLPSVRRISTICHKQGRESFNLRYASTCNANIGDSWMQQRRDIGHALAVT